MENELCEEGCYIDSPVDDGVGWDCVEWFVCMLYMAIVR